MCIENIYFIMQLKFSLYLQVVNERQYRLIIDVFKKL